MIWFKKLINANDHTVDVVSLALFAYGLLCLISIIVFIVLEIYNTVSLKHEFHPNEYGTGLAAVLGGSGLASLLISFKRINTHMD